MMPKRAGDRDLKRWTDEIGFFPVWMVRNGPQPVLQHAIPEGFAFRNYVDGDEAAWLDIHNDGHTLFEVTPRHFESSFGADRPALPDRCIFLVSPEGRDIGTATAWYNRNYNGDHIGQLHWVCLRRTFQGCGLGKPLMSKVLRRMAELHDRCCLSTQTPRVPAIRLYLRFGFSPDIRDDEAAQAWRRFHAVSPHPTVAKALQSYERIG
jgi:GNAT superfamily N-acetyltransferase